MTASGNAIIVGVGSNLRPQDHIPQALSLLREAFGEVRLSTFYATRPLGGLDQPPYVNGVVAASSALDLAAVRALLRGIESRCGRVRHSQERFASRTLDLDLLAFGDSLLPAEHLPAEELLDRDFCLVPAAEVLPEWVHPALGQPLRRLAEERFPVRPHIIRPVAFPVD